MTEDTKDLTMLPEAVMQQAGMTADEHYIDVGIGSRATETSTRMREDTKGPTIFPEADTQQAGKTTDEDHIDVEPVSR